MEGPASAIGRFVHDNPGEGPPTAHGDSGGSAQRRAWRLLAQARADSAAATGGEAEGSAVAPLHSSEKWSHCYRDARNDCRSPRACCAAADAAARRRRRDSAEASSPRGSGDRAMPRPAAPWLLSGSNFTAARAISHRLYARTRGERWPSSTSCSKRRRQSRKPQLWLSAGE